MCVRQYVPWCISPSIVITDILNTPNPTHFASRSRSPGSVSSSPPKWGPFWGYILACICTRTEYKDILGQCVPVYLCTIWSTPKWVHFGGILGGPVERVFNKTRSLTQSLYARARIGIVSSGVGWLKWTQNSPNLPLDYPSDLPGA